MTVHLVRDIGKRKRSEDLTRRVLQMARNLVTSADEVETAAPATALTEREKLILTLIASGRSLKEISQELAIGSTTLRNHISHINRKLGTNSRLSAALRAIKNGLI